MTDKPLFNLDTDGRWRLAYDRQQWVIQRRVGKPLPGRSDSSAGATSGWQAVSFVGGTPTTLERLFRAKGIVLTPEAQSGLNGLPEQFLEFAAAPDRFAVRWPEAA